MFSESEVHWDLWGLSHGLHLVVHLQVGVLAELTSVGGLLDSDVLVPFVLGVAETLGEVVVLLTLGVGVFAELSSSGSFLDSDGFAPLVLGVAEALSEVVLALSVVILSELSSSVSLLNSSSLAKIVLSVSKSLGEVVIILNLSGINVEWVVVLLGVISSSLAVFVVVMPQELSVILSNLWRLRCIVDISGLDVVVGSELSTPKSLLDSNRFSVELISVHTNSPLALLGESDGFGAHDESAND